MSKFWIGVGVGFWIGALGVLFALMRNHWVMVIPCNH